MLALSSFRRYGTNAFSRPAKQPRLERMQAIGVPLVADAGTRRCAGEDAGRRGQRSAALDGEQAEGSRRAQWHDPGKKQQSKLSGSVWAGGGPGGSGDL